MIEESLSTADKAKIDRSIIFLDLLSAFCALIIALGLVGEMLDRPRELMVSFPTTPKSNGETYRVPFDFVLRGWGETVCEIMVICGVSGELVFGLMAVRLNFKRISVDRLETSRNNKERTELNVNLEELRNANLKLKERLAPRTLTPEQYVALQKSLIGFAPQAIDLLTCGETAEIIRFQNDIIRALAMSGWTMRFWSVTPMGFAVTGIWPN